MTEAIENLDARDLQRIRAVMDGVVEKTSAREEDCVYRGEPQCNPIVSSGLYRKCSDAGNERFDIGRVEKQIIGDARSYTALTEDVEILAEIQHYGGATNLIDFTGDYLVALFFACAGRPGSDGRVVLHWPDPETLVTPKQTNNRIISQKSVFVRPQRGFILPNTRENTISVPAGLKDKILHYLDRYHDISRRTVFNDIHGFIRHQDPSLGDYARAFRDVHGTRKPERKVDLKNILDGKPIFSVRIITRYHVDNPRGIVNEEQIGSELEIDSFEGETGTHYCFSEELKSIGSMEFLTDLVDAKINGASLHEALCMRGAACLSQGETDSAIRDFDRALSINSDSPGAYHGRGNVYLLRENFDRGIADLNEALRLDPGLVEARIDRGNAHRQNGGLAYAIEDFDAVLGTNERSARQQRTEHPQGHFYRGIARCVLEDWRRATFDFEVARTHGILIATSFRNICSGTAGFENKHAVSMPCNVATMLHMP